MEVSVAPGIIIRVDYRFLVIPNLNIHMVSSYPLDKQRTTTPGIAYFMICVPVLYHSRIDLTLLTSAAPSSEPLFYFFFLWLAGKLVPAVCRSDFAGWLGFRRKREGRGGAVLYHTIPFWMHHYGPI